MADTNLVVEVEKDFSVYGDELTFGIGKVRKKLKTKVWYKSRLNINECIIKSLREGMGQCVGSRNDTALDTIITNVVIIDASVGIIKADIGIRVYRNCWSKTTIDSVI